VKRESTISQEHSTRRQVVRPIGIQMWTVRSEAEVSLPRTLQHLKELGYDAVETAGLYGLSPSEFAGLLDSNGLRLASAHHPLPEPHAAEEAFSSLADLGATVAFCSLHEEHWTSEEDVARAADRLNHAAAAATGFGLQFGYHNHWWEFTNRIGPRPAYDTFLERLEPSVALEVDTYWVEAGGSSAKDLVARLGERTRYLHIKDGPGDLSSPNVGVGDGTLDIPAILAANPGVEWNIVELDKCDGDIWDAVAGSVKYLSALER
jgi:sugar phosphate isomerase/epimerase